MGSVDTWDVRTLVQVLTTLLRVRLSADTPGKQQVGAHSLLPTTGDTVQLLTPGFSPAQHSYCSFLESEPVHGRFYILNELVNQFL